MNATSGQTVKRPIRRRQSRKPRSAVAREEEALRLRMEYFAQQPAIYRKIRETR